MPDFTGAPLGAYVSTLKVFMVVTAVLITASSLDDLFVDAWFWIRQIYRRLFVLPKHRPLSEAVLLETAEQPIAIMVPAWREDDVIATMLENTISTLSYENYTIFVGTYPNDPDTIREVERVRRRHRRIVRVDVGHDGPTCKADCLNAIVAAIQANEVKHGREFAGVILHDCEDVLHPIELKFFNYLLPRKDLIQLPVVSLERKLSELVAGTYMDEFAEWHAKDLVVRESLAQSVPSAGVGTCFSRRAIRMLCEACANEPFNTASLTEDYDIGARLAKAGMSTIIPTYPVEFRVKRRATFGRATQRSLTMPLCVREFFPNTFRTAYRQKARWILGIALQGWAQLGWSRSWRANYFLARDRKALITPTLAIISYVLALNFLVLRFLAPRFGFEAPSEILPTGPLFAALLVFNTMAVVLRAGQRMYFVNRLYGWEHALMSAPRMIVGTFVNYAATMRAVRIYAGSLVFGTPIAWDKTMHHYPTSDLLAQDRRKLGDILTTWETVSPARLETALSEQQSTRQPLGKILLAKGWLDDETLAEAIATQSDLPRGRLSDPIAAAARKLLPEALSIRLRAIPLGKDETGAVVLAVAGPLGAKDVAAVKAETGAAPVQKIVREGEVVAALRLLRGQAGALRANDKIPLLGDMLIDGGHIERATFGRAMQAYQPDRDGRVGEFLLKLGVVTQDALTHVLALQRRALAQSAASH